MELQEIQTRIHEIRGEKVILDMDLAPLYEVETRALNQAVKRNQDRFPIDFMFQLTDIEWNAISSQIVMTSRKRPKRALPFAFTEHGVTMAASVLKSPKARQMNVAIVRAFISMRKLLRHHNEIIEQLKELKERVGEHDVQLGAIYETIENLLDEKVTLQSWKDRDRIGFKPPGSDVPAAPVEKKN